MHTQDSFAQDRENTAEHLEQGRKPIENDWSPATVQGHHIEACVEWVEQGGRSP